MTKSPRLTGAAKETALYHIGSRMKFTKNGRWMYQRDKNGIVWTDETLADYFNADLSLLGRPVTKKNIETLRDARFGRTYYKKPKPKPNVAPQFELPLPAATVAPAFGVVGPPIPVAPESANSAQPVVIGLLRRIKLLEQEIAKISKRMADYDVWLGVTNE